MFGVLGKKQVVAMKGRFHFYEGYTPQQVNSYQTLMHTERRCRLQVALPVRVLAALGIKALIVTNAAGGALWLVSALISRIVH